MTNFKTNENSRQKTGTGVWNKLFAKYFLLQRKRFVLLILAAIVVAICEASFALVTKQVIDEIVGNREAANLWIPGVAYSALIVTITISVWLFIVLAGGISTQLMYDIRKDCFHHLQRLPFSFYDSHSVGWLMARMTSDCQRLAHVVAWGTLDLFWGVPFLVGISAVMLILNWQLGLLVLAVVPPLAWASFYFRRIILESSRRVRKSNSRLTAAYNEGIDGITTSKVLARERENLTEFREQTDEMARVSIKNELQAAAYLPVVMSLGSIATGMALWVGGEKVIAAVITLGTLVAFFQYTETFFEPVLEIAHVLTELQTAQASAERIFGLLDTVPNIGDGNVAKAERFGNAAIQTIEFKSVAFHYDKNLPVLSNFNLRVDAGESVALVGATGGGKSTIVNLLCRFYEPNRGEILIDGLDYRKRPLFWLQSKLGIVLQTPHLFSGSIYDNIRYGRPDATEKQIREAARLASAHDFIAAMREGYGTDVGKGGANLSTGQKQLVSFARAILADPQILILDEATSSVDVHTENLIQEGLGNILKNRTSFIIAHRLSTIRSADRILVVERGELKEQGTHRQLMAKRGAYFELYKRQFCFEREKELYSGGMPNLSDP